MCVKTYQICIQQNQFFAIVIRYIDIYKKKAYEMPQILLLPLSVIIGKLINIKANCIKLIPLNENLICFMFKRQHMRV